MSDIDLRTRLAAAIYPLMPVEYPQPEDAEEVADAVIRELDMTPERLDSKTGHPTTVTRWVTGWESDK